MTVTAIAGKKLGKFIFTGAGMLLKLDEYFFTRAADMVFKNSTGLWLYLIIIIIIYYIIIIIIFIIIIIIIIIIIVVSGGKGDLS